MVIGYLAEFFRNKQVLEVDLNYLLSQNDTMATQDKQEEIDESVRNGYLYALLLVPLTFAFAISRANSFFLANKMGMMCRIMTTGAIYQKVSAILPELLVVIIVGNIDRNCSTWLLNSKELYLIDLILQC